MYSCEISISCTSMLERTVWHGRSLRLTAETYWRDLFKGTQLARRQLAAERITKEQRAVKKQVLRKMLCPEERQAEEQLRAGCVE